MSITKPVKPWVLLSVLVVAELTSTLEATMIYSALAQLYRDFGDPIGVGWLVTSFLLVSAGSAAVCGRLGDLFGRSQVLIVVLVLAGLGSVVSALSTKLEWIIVGRSVQGVSAAILPLCYGLVREHIRPAQVPLCIGIVAGTAAGGAGLGLLIGGVLVDSFGWHWIFWLTAVIALLGTVLALALLPTSQGTGNSLRSIDFFGGILFVPAVCGILLALGNSRSWGWIDYRTLGLIAGSLLLLVFWYRYELRHPNPLIQVRLLHHRQILLANLGFGLIALGAMQTVQVLSIMLQAPLWTGIGLGLSATLVGLLKLPSSLVGTLAAPWGGSIAARHGARRSMLIASAAVVTGWVALASYHGSFWFVACTSIVVSFGTTMAFGAVANLVVEVAPAERTSEATSLSTVVGDTAMAIGAQVVSFLLATDTMKEAADSVATYPTPAAFKLAMFFILTAAVGALVCALALPKRIVPVVEASLSGART